MWSIITEGQERIQLPFVSSITDYPFELLLLSKGGKPLTIPFHIQSK